MQQLGCLFRGITRCDCLSHEGTIGLRFLPVEGFARFDCLSCRYLLELPVTAWSEQDIVVVTPAFPETKKGSCVLLPVVLDWRKDCISGKDKS